MEPNTVAPVASKMSKKVVIGVIVVIVIALVAWAFTGSTDNSAVSESVATSTESVATSTR